MRRIPVRCLKLGSTIATDVYDSNFRVLVKKGSVVDEKIIEDLEKCKVISIYITDEYGSKDVDDVITPELRVRAAKQLKIMALELLKIQITKRYDIIRLDYIDKLRITAGKIVDELIADNSRRIKQFDIRNKENYRYYHCVNVAVLATIIGIELKYKEEKLVKLAMAGLLHDVGKIFLPNDVLEKETDRDFEEDEVFRLHTKMGYEYLSRYLNIEREVKRCILNHHEKVDGTGYPRQIRGKEIDEFSKIISVVDFYDNLIASGYILEDNLPGNVVELIMSHVESSFDYNLVRILSKKAVPFLAGTIVQLSNGDAAVVIETTQGMPLRPIVKIIKSNNEHMIDKYVNLEEKLDLVIVKVLYYLDE